jgi:hypothetical protein
LDEQVEMRRRAVELADLGWSQVAIGRELGRSREWVREWLGRYAAEGESGLVERSRRPVSSPTQLPRSVVDEILTVRDMLAGDRHANRGPVAVAAEIERRGQIDTVPSVASIKRVLANAGVSRSYRKRRRSTKGLLGLPKVTAPGIWQQADWVQDCYLEGGIRFSSLQITDVGSHAMSSVQHQRRWLLVAVRQLTEVAWPAMSIPLAMGTDNAFSKTTHRNNPWTIWLRVLLLFGVEVIISPPRTLGYTNHVEAVNGLWQDRTINRHRYGNLDELAADNIRFVDWANTRRPVLEPVTCGTRYPADYVAARTDTLRWLPAGFSIDDYLDPAGIPRLPIAKGRVTFLRHVDPNATIEIAHSHWPVPTNLPTGVLVVAAINTATAHLEIRHQGELVARHHYPLQPATTDPWHPAPTQGLLDHLPTKS